MRLGTLFPLVSGCVLVNTLFDIFMSVFISTTPLDMLFSFLFPFLGLFRPLGGCSSSSWSPVLILIVVVQYNMDRRFLDYCQETIHVSI